MAVRYHSWSPDAKFQVPNPPLSVTGSDDVPGLVQITNALGHRNTTGLILYLSKCGNDNHTLRPLCTVNLQFS
jgi:hypothetical protein